MTSFLYMTWQGRRPVVTCAQRRPRESRRAASRPSNRPTAWSPGLAPW